MNVTSVAGGTSGSTSISVEPTLTSGNSYKYKSGLNPAMPDYGTTCTTGYKTWDGMSEITVATGQKIVVVEVSDDNKCMAAGMITVTAKE